MGAGHARNRYLNREGMLNENMVSNLKKKKKKEKKECAVIKWFIESLIRQVHVTLNVWPWFFLHSVGFELCIYFPFLENKWLFIFSYKLFISSLGVMSLWRNTSLLVGNRLVWVGNCCFKLLKWNYLCQLLWFIITSKPFFLVNKMLCFEWPTSIFLCCEVKQFWWKLLWLDALGDTLVLFGGCYSWLLKCLSYVNLEKHSKLQKLFTKTNLYWDLKLILALNYLFGHGLLLTFFSNKQN